MILKVVADTGKLEYDIDTGFLEECGRAEATSLKDLRSVDSTSRDYDLGFGTGVIDGAVIQGLDLHDRHLISQVIAGVHNTGHLVVGNHVEIGARLDQLVVANAGV